MKLKLILGNIDDFRLGSPIVVVNGDSRIGNALFFNCNAKIKEDDAMLLNCLK